MRLSRISIDRPVLTLVLSTFIVVLGFISIPYLGVREFPAVDPPRITGPTPRSSKRRSPSRSKNR